MKQLEIRTERLLLRHWKHSDLEPFSDICADEKVMRHIGPGTAMTAAQVRADLENYALCWDTNGYGQFAIEKIDDGQFIGFAGLSPHTLFPQYQNFTEIGWRLAQRVWGKGYATEAAKAALKFAASHAEIGNMVSVCQVDNFASERIMQKIGLSFAAYGVAPNTGRAVKVYTLPAR